MLSRIRNLFRDGKIRILDPQHWLQYWSISYFFYFVSGRSLSLVFTEPDLASTVPGTSSYLNSWHGDETIKWVKSFWLLSFFIFGMLKKWFSCRVNRYGTVYWVYPPLLISIFFSILPSFLRPFRCSLLTLDNPKCAVFRPEYVGTWLGCCKIGVVPALINTSLRQGHTIRSFNCIPS